MAVKQSIEEWGRELQARVCTKERAPTWEEVLGVTINPDTGFTIPHIPYNMPFLSGPAPGLGKPYIIHA